MSREMTNSPIWRRRRRAAPTQDSVPIPPEDLRYRVHGSASGDTVEAYQRMGRLCAEDIVKTLASAGKKLADFKNILDFGVGCGRTLRWLAPLAPAAHFYGSDIDHEAIDWCRTNLDFASFSTNAPLPPLPFANGQFDFIYVVSVFTHLDESYQFQWLAELRRVARAGAFVLLTLHGESLFPALPKDMRELAETNGFAFVVSDFWHGIFPDWYQTTFHSQQYVSKWYNSFFQVTAHIPQGLASHQDIVLMQKV